MKNESSAPETKTIPVSCNKDCAAGCPLLANVEDGKIIKIMAKFGSESMLFLGGSGSCRGALHITGSLTQRFLNMFGGYMQTFGN